MINTRTDELVPAAQYMLYPFEQYGSYFNQKPKALEDKVIPETLVSIKISKKHMPTQQ